MKFHGIRLSKYSSFRNQFLHHLVKYHFLFTHLIHHLLPMPDTVLPHSSSNPSSTQFFHIWHITPSIADSGYIQSNSHTLPLYNTYGISSTNDSSALQPTRRYQRPQKKPSYLQDYTHFQLMYHFLIMNIIHAKRICIYLINHQAN